MPEKGRIKIGIDYDGVVVRKYPKRNPRNWVKGRFVPVLDGAVEEMGRLNGQTDVDVLGFYTVRPEWFRGGQTRKQIGKKNIPVERVVHTANSYKAKVEALLLDAAGVKQGDMLGRSFVPADVRAIVVIDDRPEKIVVGAEELAEEKPHLQPLMTKLTLAAFEPKQPERVRQLAVPGIIRVVLMEDGWASTRQMLEEVRGASK